jgi:hypothetical protein
MNFDDFLVECELADSIDIESLLKCSFTSKNISDLLSINLLTVKRWAREFFTKDKDPIEIQKEGIARTFSFDDVFTFYLIEQFLEFKKISILQTKELINKVGKWLYENGFYPSSYHKRDKNFLNCEIFFLSNYKFFDRSFFIKKILSREQIKINNEIIINEKYQIGRCFTEKPFSVAYNIDFLYDQKNWKRISISLIKEKFLFKISAQTKKSLIIIDDYQNLSFNLEFQNKEL